MKPHPKIRKTVKWAGAGLTVLLFVIWVGSSRWWLARVTTTEWGHPRWVWGLYEGRLRVTYGYGRGRLADFDYSFTELNRHDFGMRFWFESDGHEDLAAVWVPLWVFVVPVLLATATTWRLDTRARLRIRAGACPTCGYDLSATPAASGCPECGAGRG